MAHAHSLPMIGFIGAGHLNGAIIKGILDNEDSIFGAEQLLVSCKDPAKAKARSEAFALPVHTDNRHVIKKADYLVLGVKPAQMQVLLQELAEYDLSEKTIITVAAAIDIASYRKILGDEVCIIRAMPNMAAAVQASLTGIYSDQELDEDCEHIIEDLFAGVGSIAWLDDETQIDGIIALSASGIAFYFRFMQAMREAGERYGFEGEELFDIISLSSLGASTLMVDNPEGGKFSDWIEKIALKGGTTEAGLKQMDNSDFDRIIADAMQATVERSRAIGEELTKDW